MADGDNKTSFDRLVAGLSSEDRLSMLDRINQSSIQSVQLVTDVGEVAEKYDSLETKLQGETFLYKIILWIRSIFAKSTREQLYREDLLSNMAKKVTRNHPGLLNHKIKIIDYIFYERMQSLKNAADFFKPYIVLIDENPGDFYVFLSSFVAPELSEKINETADPFTLDFSVVANPEIRNDLLKKLDSILLEMSPGTKGSIYNAICATNWLKNFSLIPYQHFMSEFTNITGGFYTCAYKNAVIDFNILASVFANIMPVQNEILEALFLFSQRKSLNDAVLEKSVEKSVKDFMDQANTYFSAIQDFINGVPIVKMGKIINVNYDWLPENLDGVESWFPSFRVQWKKIIDIRWTEWIREQKKQNLSDTMRVDFGLDDFPVMEYRPWLKLWTRVPFNCELTGGFLSWFAEEKYNEIIQPLNDVEMEGVFYKSENRTEYAEGLNNFSMANNQMLELLEKLSPKGEFGTIFEDFANSRVHTFQVQKQIDSMMEQTQAAVKENLKLFGKGARTIERVFHGFFDETKDGIHESLQNMNSIKGHDNRKFREDLQDIRNLLRKSLFYLSELEPIDKSGE